MIFFVIRTYTAEASFAGCQNLESPPLSRMRPQLFCKVVNDNSCQQEKTIQKFSLNSLGHWSIFQQANHPSRNMLNGILYFFGKHKFYGFRTEVAMTPSSQAVNVTDYKPGSISDFVILQDNMTFHNHHRNC